MGIIIKRTFAHSNFQMGRLTYIIISFLMLNIFALYNYNAELVPLVCRQNTLAYHNTVKLLQVVDLEEDIDVDFVGLELDLDKSLKSFSFVEAIISHYRNNSKSFILFEADASPPLFS